jgi:ABC-type uncharacterized transport system permease subunit
MVLLYTTILISYIIQLIVDARVKQLRKKKKTKTNEIKEKTYVKLQVEFIDKTNHPTLTWTRTFISKSNLVYCVKDAILYAKTNGCIINKMYLLTTEE